MLFKNKTMRKFRNLLDSAVIWPTLEEEIGDDKIYFKGNVLNAGAGDRDISQLVDGKVYNQDIVEGIHNKYIDFYSPLHKIPVDNGFFDAIICNAVLEHVENPIEVMREFYRVLKQGGYLYLTIPFLQPEHLDPIDFQRYTKDGLIKLVGAHGFEAIKIEGVHSVYHTLGWIVQEWLNSSQTLSYKILRLILFPLLRYKCAHSQVFVHSIASAYRVLARKL